LTDQQLYKVCIGDKRAAYYLEKFEAFDRKGSGLHASWNWAALIVSVAWPLYRKMYGWFFLLWFILFIFSFGHYVPGAQPAASLIGWGLSILFAAYANSLYHLKIKKKISAARLIARNENQLLEMLQSSRGVNRWVIWLPTIIILLGVVAAIAIPAMQKRSGNSQNTAGQYSKENNVVNSVMSDVIDSEINRNATKGGAETDQSLQSHQWTRLLGNSDDITGYYDFATYRRNFNKGTIYMLLDRKKPFTIKGFSAYSVMFKVNFDCSKGEKIQELPYVYFRGHMGDGSLIREDLDRMPVIRMDKDDVETLCARSTAG
jgi:hypothetical protein